MRAAISKAEIESEIASRFGSAFRAHEKRPAEVMSSGVPQIDSQIFGGFPRGAITEVFGPASSGRTSFMLAALAHATTHDEVCAVVDTNNVFDPASAERAEVNCQRLFWIRCANNLEHAFKATDLLLQGGGFGLVLLDLGDVPATSAKRIISSWWYRFRRTLEATPTVLVVIAEESCVRSCAALALALRGEKYLWSSSEEWLSIDNKVSKIQRNGFGSNRALKSVSIAGVSDLRAGHSCKLPSHAKVLRGLRFQVDCQRPQYLNKREILVSVGH